MRQALSKTPSQAATSDSVESTRAVPTFIATDLLEKLIADRDARAVDRVVTARRH